MNPADIPIRAALVAAGACTTGTIAAEQELPVARLLANVMTHVALEAQNARDQLDAKHAEQLAAERQDLARTWGALRGLRNQEHARNEALAAEVARLKPQASRAAQLEAQLREACSLIHERLLIGGDSDDLLYGAWRGQAEPFIDQMREELL